MSRKSYASVLRQMELSNVTAQEFVAYLIRIGRIDLATVTSLVNEAKSQEDHELDSVQKKVIQIIVDKLGYEEDDVTLDSSFAYDLGCDSLDSVELLMEAEKAFDVTIPDDKAANIKTVRDLCDCLSVYIS